MQCVRLMQMLLVACAALMLCASGGVQAWSFGWGGGQATSPPPRVYGPVLPADQQWTYKDTGKWPTECTLGSRQSPIAFSNTDPSEVVPLKSLTRLRFSPECNMAGNATDMKVRNEGNTITINLRNQLSLSDEPSACTVADPLDASEEYHFDSITFHVPAEHSFRGFQPDAEMQIYFTTADERRDARNPFLVIAVFLKAVPHISTPATRNLQHFFVDGRLPPPHARTTCTLTTDLDLATLLPPRENYLLYNGSLTTPPCTEGVRWVVMTSPVFITPLALGKLQEALSMAMKADFDRYGNARPPQPLNNRHIFRYVDTQSGAWRRADGIARDAWRKHDVERALVESHDVTQTAATATATPPLAAHTADGGSAETEVVVVDVYDNSSYHERVANDKTADASKAPLPREDGVVAGYEANTTANRTVDEGGVAVSAARVEKQAERDQRRAAANTAHVERSDHAASKQGSKTTTAAPQKNAKKTTPTQHETKGGTTGKHKAKTPVAAKRRDEGGVAAWFGRTGRGMRRGLRNIWRSVTQHPLRAFILLIVACLLVCISIMAWCAWHYAGTAVRDAELRQPLHPGATRGGRYGTNPV